MSEKGVIGFLGLLAVAAGYGGFGWRGALGGLLIFGLVAAGRPLKRRWCGCRPAGRERASLGKGFRPIGGDLRRSRLEALLKKAHLLADTFQDVYGARNCCLEIIRQTEKEDPLFLEACTLFMRTMERPPVDGPERGAGQEAAAPRIDVGRASPGEANVIPFPLSPSRR